MTNIQGLQGVNDSLFVMKGKRMKDVKKIALSLSLFKRFGKHKELVGAAIFLASDESSYMTAQTLSVNGGAWVH